MPFNQAGSIRYYSFDILQLQGLVQGIFTRQGGKSPAPWASLNTGGTVGDSRDNVIENRHRIFNSVGCQVETIYDVWQVHGNDVVCVDAPRPLDTPYHKADAILTDRVGVTLFMRFADCVPIFLFDPIQKVIGIVHAGWQGTVLRVSASAVQVMVQRYHTKPHNILAGIGPSIGSDHYEVGDDVVSHLQEAFGMDSSEMIIQRDNKPYLDLWKANLMTLTQVGVNTVQTAGICTACHTEDWYSHRKEHGKTGRFGAIIALRGEK